MKRLMMILLSVLLVQGVSAQKKNSKKKDKKEVYKFEKIYEVKHTSVKDQQHTGTCWSFATSSFIEAELLRTQNKELDLAEMYFVRHAYEMKARNYILRQGQANFSQGGQAHDVLNVIRKNGMALQANYPGKLYEGKEHSHNEMEIVLKSILDGVLKAKRGGISSRWEPLFTAALDIYMGKDPEKMDFEEQELSPRQFSKKMQFNPDDYVELTSFTHHPFYQLINLEVPDNWSGDLYYNIPLSEMIQIIDNALKNGYSVCWDGDVSEKAFSHKHGVALIPADEKDDNLYKEIVEEKEITPELRQEYFERLLSTDDHLMHLVGQVKDQNGNLYYTIKNSWGDDSNDFGGYLKMSAAYVQFKTIAIMVHKDAIPAAIKVKLGL